jgi:hypothetical protein
VCLLREVSTLLHPSLCMSEMIHTQRETLLPRFRLGDTSGEGGALGEGGSQTGTGRAQGERPALQGVYKVWERLSTPCALSSPPAAWSSCELVQLVQKVRDKSCLL